MSVGAGTVQVVMPAMGDSVSEGTVLEWHKQEGDSVEVDETIVEISTDKVDAEVPSPAAGTIVRGRVKCGAGVKEGIARGGIWPEKVDRGLPAPASGTITEILFAEGDTVSVGQVIARMAAGGAALTSASASASAPALAASG